MVERFHDVEALFRHDLAVAHSMEHDSLSLWNLWAQAARGDVPRTLFREHAEQTRTQIANVEHAFDLIGAKPHDARCGATKSMASATNSALHKADGVLFDLMALSSGLAAAHFEMGTYEGLIFTADAGIDPPVAEVLRANLEQERSVVERIREAAADIARTMAEQGRPATPSTPAQEPDPWS